MFLYLGYIFDYTVITNFIIVISCIVMFCYFEVSSYGVYHSNGFKYFIKLYFCTYFQRPINSTQRLFLDIFSINLEENQPYFYLTIS